MPRPYGGAVAAPAPTRRWSFRLVRVAGIEIRVHATFFLLVALFALAGAAPRGPGVVASLAWLAAIFVCVVLHELAHCLVGRRRGLVVHEIDLLPIGGVSRLENMPETPGDELAVAVAGPVASVLLGLVAALLATAASVSIFPVDLVDGPFLARLAWLNLLLAAFNMLPAFPLDGGRVLRAALERRHDLEQATRIAATTGRWLAFALIATGMFVNLWLAVIGVFIYLGANAEEAATSLHLRLAGRRVRDVMLAPPMTFDASVTGSELRRVVQRSGQDVFPVARGGCYVGVVDRRSLAGAPDDASAGDLADVAAVTASPARAITVVDGDRVVGLLRSSAIDRVVAASASDPAPQG